MGEEDLWRGFGFRANHVNNEVYIKDGFDSLGLRPGRWRDTLEESSSEFLRIMGVDEGERV